MVVLNVDQLQQAMSRQSNIRNIAVIAHVDHGKTTLTDSLLARAGVIAMNQAGDKRATDTRKDEQEKGITIKSTAISLYYDFPSQEGGEKDDQSSGYLVNLVDSPGHVDFSPEVTAALRIVDGAMVVVDCASGVSVQTETVLRQALCERIKPVLMMNKLDRSILELQMTSEDIYLSLRSVVEGVNALIWTYAEDDGPMGDISMDPSMGNVTFGSGLHGWAFNLHQFAKLYSSKFKIDEKKIMKRLWGDNFYNTTEKKWDKGSEGSSRGFNLFVIDPIIKLCKAALNGDKETVRTSLSKVNVHLNAADLELDNKAFMKAVMKKWLPAADAMLDMIVSHLPSPATAQAYRTEILYEGPMDDDAAMAMKNCDPEGPLMMYVSMMVPSLEKGHFYAVGRIFSGTVVSGQKVRIMGPDYDPNALKKKHLYFQQLSSAKVMMASQTMTVHSAQCGNIIGLSKVDKCLVKTGTLSTYEHAHNLKVLKFSVSPVMRVAVDPVHASDLPKLIEGLRRLSKSDPLVQCIHEDGQNIVAGAGELHLQICLSDLENMFACVPIKKSNPVVKYCETVRAESDRICLAKTANKLNRIFMTASPLSDDLCLQIEQGDVSQDLKERARYLTDKHGFDIAEARKIWCFGPQGSGPNMLVDVTKGVHLSDIKDTLCAGFQWSTDEGVLCEETMRGVRFNLTDALVHSDAAHRGGGQILPATRRAMMASCLTASPALLEPVFLVETQCPTSVIGSVMNVLSRRRGVVIEQAHAVGSPMVVVKAHMPVNEAFGFTEDLRSQTSGQAFPQCIFDHWQILPGDPTEEGSKAASVVTEIRLRKGLSSKVPGLENFLDKL